MSAIIESEKEITLGSTKMTLRGDGTVYVPESRSLLVADLHLGKDISFQRSGLPVPGFVSTKTLSQIEQSLESVSADQLIVLGDLIHDRKSLNLNLVQAVTRLIDRFPKTEFVLVRGNHDRHLKNFPEEWRLIVRHSLNLGELHLIHDPLSVDEIGLVVGGHIHPVTWIGDKSQGMRLRCFASSNHRLVLPAFGPFKGGAMQSLRDWPKLFPICEGRIWQLEKR